MVISYDKISHNLFSNSLYMVSSISLKSSLLQLPCSDVYKMSLYCGKTPNSMGFLHIQNFARINFSLGCKVCFVLCGTNWDKLLCVFGYIVHNLQNKTLKEFTYSICILGCTC